MIDKEEIKKVSDTIEIVKSNIEEYEILYSNLLKGMQMNNIFKI